MVLRTVASALLLLTTTGCVNYHSTYDAPNKQLIAQHDQSDGQSSYSLVQRSNDQATLHRSVDSTRKVAYLGLVTANVDGELARALGVVAWNGVYIESVVAGSPADDAGLVAGDILRSIADEEIGSKDEVQEFIEGRLSPGDEFEILVQRWEANGDDLMLAGHRLNATAGSRDVKQTIKESFPLELAAGVQKLTGLGVAQIPADLANEVWGSSAGELAVTGVITGSPAYHAGFRTGDRIVSIDGSGPTSLADLERAVAAKALSLGIEPSLVARGSHGNWIGDGLEPHPADVVVEVSGPLGAHVAPLTITEDLDDDSEVYIPIILDWESDVRGTDWSFLDFIFQFGANYRGTYGRQSDSRQPAHSTYFSMLPFGMFEYRSGRYDTNSGSMDSEYTFFWFITIG